jgi:hypothetical protein
MIMKLGQWLESKDGVRKYFREYRKGILRRGAELGIIFAYRGARRVHYGDKLRHRQGEVLYIGEGKRGDQKLTPGNKALLTAIDAKTPLKLFLDCGDVFKPKKLLYAGEWKVVSHRYGKIGGARRVYQFRLRPYKDSERVLRFLAFTFASAGVEKTFEKDLTKFADARHRFYLRHSSILRSQDNIIGEIGEYFAVKEFNRRNPERPLIRLRTATKDLDAIQIGTGKRFAIKTVGDLAAATSNIWSPDIAKAVDYFLLVRMNRARLHPQVVCQIGSSKVKSCLRKDAYQNTHKIVFDEKLLRRSRILWRGEDYVVRSNGSARDN